MNRARAVLGRLAGVLFLSLAVAVMLPVPAWGWCNGPDRGNGFGTHDWILAQAVRIAATEGASWVHLNAALRTTDNPDTVLRDFAYHSYDIWGRRFGKAPSRIRSLYFKIVRMRKSGDDVAASRALGLLAHYYADICEPLNTDACSTERQIRIPYERMVEGYTDDAAESRGWVVYDGNDPVYRPGANAVAAAKTAHRSYQTLVDEFAASGFDTQVASITQESLNRAVNGLADFILTLNNVANARDYGAKGDGLTNDSGAIKLALGALARRGTGVLYLPAGTYRVSALTIPNKVSVAGDGRSSSWLKGKITAGSDLTVSNLKLGVAGKSFTVANGAHDSAFESCEFTGGGDQGTSDPAVVIFYPKRYGHDFSFRDCVIDANAGNGNGVTVWDYGRATAHFENIVFDHCHFLGSPCMNLEVQQGDDGQPIVTGFKNINVYDSVFEASGSEQVSYGGKFLSAGGDFASGWCTVQGCTFKGSGANSLYPWGQGIEMGNVTHMVFSGNTVLRGRGAMLNHDSWPGKPGYDVITNNTFDATRGTVAAASDAIGLFFEGDGNTFSGNTVITNTGGGPVLFVTRANGNVFENNSITDTRGADTAHECIYAKQTSCNNHFTGNRLSTAKKYGCVTIVDNSNDNWLTSNTFLMPSSLPIVVGAGLRVNITP